MMDPYMNDLIVTSNRKNKVSRLTATLSHQETPVFPPIEQEGLRLFTWHVAVKPSENHS